MKAPALGPLEVPAQPEKLVWTCLVVLVYRQAGSHPPGQRPLESLHIPNISVEALTFRVPPCALSLLITYIIPGKEVNMLPFVSKK